MTNNVIQKVYNGWNEYFVAGGVSGEWHEFITQASYDALTPAQKAEKVYMITGEGETPTPGGETVWLDSNIALNKINQVLSTVNTSCYIWRSSTAQLVSIYWKNSSLIWYYDISRDGWYQEKTYETYYILLQSYNSSYSSNKHYIVHVVDIENNNKQTLDIPHDNITNWWEIKTNWEYIYLLLNSNTTTNWYKAPISDIEQYEEITQVEYDAVVDYSNSIDGLFYAQDNDDYVATDINGTEVKRYVWIGTVTWIANGKLWRTVWDVSYAIATI